MFKYPLDRITDSGTPFWSGGKKPPTPLEFCSTDPLHLDFIKAAASMRSQMFGIVILPHQIDDSWISNVLETVVVPNFE